mgnify:CR=1 FL=1
MAGEAAALCFLTRAEPRYDGGMSNGDQERSEVVFRGRVQGVFFRATTVDVARRFDVTGWVRNEADGSVRMVAEGDSSELDRFVAAVEEAKKGNIEEVQVKKSAAMGEFETFEIRR